MITRQVSWPHSHAPRCHTVSRTEGWKECRGTKMITWEAEQKFISVIKMKRPPPAGFPLCMEQHLHLPGSVGPELLYSWDSQSSSLSSKEPQAPSTAESSSHILTRPHLLTCWSGLLVGSHNEQLLRGLVWTYFSQSRFSLNKSCMCHHALLKNKPCKKKHGHFLTYTNYLSCLSPEMQGSGNAAIESWLYLWYHILKL